LSYIQSTYAFRRIHERDLQRFINDITFVRNCLSLLIIVRSSRDCDLSTVHRRFNQELKLRACNIRCCCHSITLTSQHQILHTMAFPVITVSLYLPWHNFRNNIKNVPWDMSQRLGVTAS